MSIGKSRFILSSTVRILPLIEIVYSARMSGRANENVEIIENGLYVLTVTARRKKYINFQVTHQLFPYEYADENGETENGSRQQLAIPKMLYDNGEIYIVYSIEKNGEKRNFVKLADVMIGAEKTDLMKLFQELRRQI